MHALNNRFKRLVALSSMLIIMACATHSVPLAGATPIPEFAFSGSGWGHGVGMSQYGAMARAARGHSAVQIVKAYFTGVEVSTQGSPRVRVNLDSDHNPREIWRIRPGRVGGAIVVDGVEYPDALYRFVSSGGKIVMANDLNQRVAFLSSEVTVKPSAGSGALLEVYDKSGPFNHKKIRYRGSLTFTTAGSSVYCVNNLNMQQYLYGVLPREIGSSASIGSAAYEAQALAARSYAYRHIKAQGSTSLWCTTRHQVYGGHSRWLSEDARASGAAYAHESSYANAGVNATKDQYITHDDKVITAYFSACNGDYTANSEDVWNSALSYTRSRKDSYCTLAHQSHSWLESMNGLELANRLKQKGVRVPSGAGTTVWVDRLVPAYDSGNHWVTKLLVKWSNGAETSIERGDNVRIKLGFRSAQFKVNRVIIDQVKRYEDGHGSIRKVGTWNRKIISGNSGGAIRISGRVSNYFEATFTGTGITWVGPKASTYGKARVYIDGTYKKTVSMRSSKTVRQQPLYTVDGLDDSRQHTIQVRVTYYDSSAKTVGYVGLDALDVYNGSLVTPPKAIYNEDDQLILKTKVGWRQMAGSGYSGGTALVNSTYSKYFTANFKGQGIVWYSRKSPTAGRAKVYLDGKYVKLVDLASSSTSPSTTAYRITNLDPTKMHSLKVVVIYKKGNRTKTGGVVLDKLLVYDGTLVK